MKAYVYTDGSLERHAGRFVWLSINTENSKNAAFLGKYPIPAVPTLLIIDPQREAAMIRHVGALTAMQLGKLLDDARAKSRGDADLTLARADKLAGEGKQAEAAKLYAAAIDSAPGGWKRFSRAAEALVLALSLTGKNEECAFRAVALYPRLKGAPAGANVAAVGLDCASGLDAAHASRAALLGSLEPAAKAELANANLDISDDDRSSIYIALIGARESAGDKEGATRLQEEWAAFLESAAAKAANPEQRTVYDSHRLSAYLELGTPEKAIPMLEQSARDFPNDYNPYSRMALAYKAMKKLDEALAASTRALELAYGPRKLGILRTRADIFQDRGDRQSARTTIADAVAYARSLPAEQVRPATIAALEKRLAELE